MPQLQMQERSLRINTNQQYWEAEARWEQQERPLGDPQHRCGPTCHLRRLQTRHSPLTSTSSPSHQRGFPDNSILAALRNQSNSPSFSSSDSSYSAFSFSSEDDSSPLSSPNMSPTNGHHNLPRTPTPGSSGGIGFPYRTFTPSAVEHISHSSSPSSPTHILAFSEQTSGRYYHHQYHQQSSPIPLTISPQRRRRGNVSSATRSPSKEPSFPPNKKLILFGFDTRLSVHEIEYLCSQHADFQPPLEMKTDGDGNFVGLVKLIFRTIEDCKAAHFNFNHAAAAAGSSIFAKYGNPGVPNRSTKQPEKHVVGLSDKLRPGSEPFHPFHYSTSFGQATASQTSINVSSHSSHSPRNPLTSVLSVPIPILHKGSHCTRQTFDTKADINRLCHKLTDISLNSVDGVINSSMQLTPTPTARRGAPTTIDTSRDGDFSRLSVHTSQMSPMPVISRGGELRTLTVSAKTQVKSIAGAIAHTIRQAQSPVILAGGAPGVNLAVKAVAIAREYLEGHAIDLLCHCEKSNDSGGYKFTVSVSKMDLHSEEVDGGKLLKVSKHSKIKKVAGAITKDVRKSKRAAIGAMGSGSVYQAIKSVVVARSYLKENDLDIKIQPGFISLYIGEGGTEKRSVLRIMVFGYYVAKRLLLESI